MASLIIKLTKSQSKCISHQFLTRFRNVSFIKLKFMKSIFITAHYLLALCTGSTIGANFKRMILFFLLTCLLTKCDSSNVEQLFVGGESCKNDADCFSGHCYEKDTNGICAPDSLMNGTIAAGGDCQSDQDCFSEFCYENICASESQSAGFVAGGGFCSSNTQCYSGVCYKGRCGPESEELGKSAAGAWCNEDKQCYSRKCRSHRCGADSPVPGVVPSGGHCNAATNWCSSKVCHRSRCTAAGMLGKVADGGKCTESFQCMNGSVCRETFCVSSAAPTKVVSDTDQKRPKGPGERCTLTTQCAYSLCIRSHCAPPSPTNRALIADGGECDGDIQCHSGQCENGVCATSYADHKSSPQLAAAGAVCGQNAHCYSGACIENICSAESPAPMEKWLVNSKEGTAPNNAPTISTATEPPTIRGGLVAGGGLCNADQDCYSGYCSSDICAPDGPLSGTISDGGICNTNKQCFSGYCRDGKCAAGTVAGKVAPGSRCKADETQCAQSSQCTEGYCRRMTKSDVKVPKTKDDLGTLSLGEGPCLRNAECRTGRCLYQQCTASWFVINKWMDSASTRLSISWLWIIYSIGFVLMIHKIWD